MQLPIVPIVIVGTATQALTTLGALALAAVAPKAAAELGVSAALIGYQVGVVYIGGILSALVGGGLVRRFGATYTTLASLWVAAAGCLVSALGSLPALAAGAFVIGLGYGMTNPAASHLLSRAPTARHMNLIFSIKQCGVPIGGVLAGLLMPPLTLAFGWQAALVVCAALMAALSVAIAPYRSSWDGDREPAAAVLGAPLASLALIWSNGILRWLALSSLAYSAVQLSLTGFLVTYLVAEAGIDLVLAGTLLAITHAMGAVGRLSWGWIADRLRSGTLALAANGVLAIAGGLATAAIAAGWPVWLIAAATALFGFSAMGWNGVFVAVIARQAPPRQVSIATGGVLAITYAGIVIGPTAFAALHDWLGFSYSAAYAAFSLVSLLGIACLVQARRNIVR